MDRMDVWTAAISIAAFDCREAAQPAGCHFSGSARTFGLRRFQSPLWIAAKRHTPRRQGAGEGTRSAGTQSGDFVTALQSAGRPRRPSPRAPAWPVRRPSPRRGRFRRSPRRPQGALGEGGNMSESPRTGAFQTRGAPLRGWGRRPFGPRGGLASAPTQPPQGAAGGSPRRKPWVLGGPKGPAPAGGGRGPRPARAARGAPLRGWGWRPFGPRAGLRRRCG